ncbi:MAG: hypothetical protein ICV55_04750 [Coleofasciculus sp. C3-bin4]|nr:hypothetical protein [Coleofasciculus sp. C3-bin4]
MQSNLITKLAFAATLVSLLSDWFTAVQAQLVQIPTLQVCNYSSVQGTGLVRIARRTDSLSAGTFRVSTNLKCNPKGVGYPEGTLSMSEISMSDSDIKGAISMSVEQITTTGKHSPTVYLNGRCKAQTTSGKNIPGCRFWMMIADNKQANQKGTPDIVGFLVFDGTGSRVAYGTGPVEQGDITVGSTPF